MKHLNNYKIFERNKNNLKFDINRICYDYGIINYTINDDGSIDVEGDVDFLCKELKKLPLKFNRVKNDFSISKNSIKSLEDTPKYVGGNFYCRWNNIIRR